MLVCRLDQLDLQMPGVTHRQCDSRQTRMPPVHGIITREAIEEKPRADRVGQPSTASSPLHRAWMRAMESFLALKDFADARVCIVHALETSQAIPIRALADYYWRSGQVSRLDPRVNEFNLPPRQFRDLQIELARRLVSESSTDRAWPWIESVASLLDDAQGRSLLQSVAD